MHRSFCWFCHAPAPLVLDYQCGSSEIYTIGTIESFDSDANGYYDNDVNCYWTIHTDDSNVTRQFYIARMDIQWTPDCEADYLKVTISHLSRLMTKPTK